MPATITEARDQMLSRLKTDYDANPSGFGNLVIMWDDSANDPPIPDPQVVTPLPWARVNVKHTTGRQTAIGKSGVKGRYTRGGFLIIQLFTPGNKGLVSSDAIITMILAAFEGKTTSGGLVFRNGRFQEVGQDGPWHQTNIFVDFEYDDIH